MLRLVMYSLLHHQKAASCFVPVMFKHTASRQRFPPVKRTPTSPSSSSSKGRRVAFRASLECGTEVEVVVQKLGPLGASVKMTDGSASGLILQKELLLLMDRRKGKAVRVGETLVGYVQNVRDTGKVDVSLRPPRPADKIRDAKQVILARIRLYGSLPVGDKSTPGNIGRLFPGITKTVFKNAIGVLYKEKKVIPGPHETILYHNNSSSSSS